MIKVEKELKIYNRIREDRCMGKVDEYKKILENLADWDQYLLDESNLPGPRANLELANAVAEVGDVDRFRGYLAYGPDDAPYGSALEFLPLCAVIGLGRILSEGRLEMLEELRTYATDQRWRVREGVAMALQRFGDKGMDRLLLEMEKWSHGNLLEKRAVIAGISEPRLLRNPEDSKRVLEILDEITRGILLLDQRKTEGFVALRKALGYCWSVAVVASPEAGKRMMENWFSNEDKDIKWIMKENLKKNRLQKLDMEWTKRWQSELQKR